MAGPPALLWGVAWRLMAVETLALLLAGDLVPWVPAGTLPLSLIAVAAWGLPLGLPLRRGTAGATWRVLAAGSLLALSLGRPVALIATIAVALLLCTLEPLALAVERRRRRNRPVDPV